VEVGVDAVTLVSIYAGEGVLGVVAGQRFLIEYGSKTTEEGPHAELGHTLTVFEGVANVEDLAIVALVSVVSKVTVCAIETELDIGANGGCVGNQLEVVWAGVPADAGDGHGTGN